MDKQVRLPALVEQLYRVLLERYPEGIPEDLEMIVGVCIDHMRETKDASERRELLTKGITSIYAWDLDEALMVRGETPVTCAPVEWEAFYRMNNYMCPAANMNTDDHGVWVKADNDRPLYTLFKASFVGEETMEIKNVITEMILAPLSHIQG